MRPIRFPEKDTFVPKMETRRRWWQGKKKFKAPPPKTMVIDRPNMSLYNAETDTKVDRMMATLRKEHADIANDIRVRTRLDPVAHNMRNILNVGNATMLGIRRLTNDINASLTDKSSTQMMDEIHTSIQTKKIKHHHGAMLIERAEEIARLEKDIENLRQSIKIDTAILGVVAEGADKFYQQMIDSRLDVLSNGKVALDQLADIVMAAFTQTTKLIADRDIFTNMVVDEKETVSN